MRRLLPHPFNYRMKRRLSALEHINNHPIATQEALLRQLLRLGARTSFGKAFEFSSVERVQTLRERVPIHTYEQLYPYIERMLQGEKNVLWPSPIKWFAKSSGTTNGRSKFIPVSSEALHQGHYKAGKDVLGIYVNNYPHNRLARGKSIGVSGSLQANPIASHTGIQCGDVSAILTKNLPCWIQHNRVPKLSIALMENFEDKVNHIATITARENITIVAGIPTWVLLILQHILAMRHQRSIHDVWPMFELFVHGGISLTPYKAMFQKITSQKLNYLEVYNASEGFFAAQDQADSTDMLLLLDHGVYYEFLSLEELGKSHPTTIGLEDVVLDKAYALVISTNAGLWRYQIGDTVKFTSLSPFRIKIVGRTRSYINTFGEELMVENADVAIAHACQRTGAIIQDYTAGPRYAKADEPGRHEWVIEFVQPPDNMAHFVDVLDATLQQVNTDYEAKRQHSLILGAPLVHCVPTGSFYRWLKQQGRLKEQSKVPRLFNDRTYLEELLALL